ncbi:RteC domain-containing protein [Echinicola vietnamensis]|uniref:RteC protein n=1 Tax=Echinicola vietnamensis (strain DSM 17526 / LMG 23754 / KMM 6221) TaxID=926556 RepID=L0G6E1_ECHVK|nr:RteC domain-containing protein [Echinicola vietnamensis]AGA80551.1 RteC protein [Echinicola vietnamensis DSM 17526]
MDIQKLAQTLKERLDRELPEASALGEDRLFHLQAAHKNAEKVLGELDVALAKYEFGDEAAEIHFFKHIKPDFHSESIYYAELFNLESARPISQKGDQVKYLLKEQQKLQAFLNFNRDLHQYYMLDRTHFDRHYFLRAGRADFLVSRAFHTPIDRSSCTVACLGISTILAAIRINKYINSAIQSLQGPPATAQKQVTLKWTGKKNQLVELVYALKVAGVLNHGQAEIREVAKVMGQLLGGDMGDVYKRFQEIRIRKKGRTLFLEVLKEKLEDYILESEGL